MRLHHLTSQASISRIAIAGAITAALCLGACSTSNEHPQSPAALETARSEALARLEDSTSIVTQSRDQIPEDIAAQARCIVVVPSMKKGGLIVGGESGRGFAACQTANGWSGPAPVRIGGGTFGAQVGFQSADVLALLTSESASRKLESGKLTVGVDASAAAGPVGKGRGKYEGGGPSEIVTYSRAQGLFAGATLNGTSIGADADATEALYGSPVSMRSILHGDVPPPPQPEVARFRTALRDAFPPTPRVARDESGLRPQ